MLKVDLLAVADELGLEVSKAIRKPEIVGKISACGASADEMAEAVDEVQLEETQSERKRGGTKTMPSGAAKADSGH